MKCLICDEQIGDLVPGPIERRLWARLHWRLFRSWPRSVAAERMTRAMLASARMDRHWDREHRDFWTE